jgi:hypothetical protein
MEEKEMEPYIRLQDMLPDYDFYLERLKLNLVSKIHTIISAHRGYGALDLVFATTWIIEQEHYNFRTCHLDMLQVQSGEEFVIKISESLQQIPVCNNSTHPSKHSGDGEKAIDKGYRLTRETIEDLLWLPEFMAIQHNIKLAFIISNFHHLFRFDDSLNLFHNINTTWKKHKNCVYCLVGNKAHLQYGLLDHPQRPARLFVKKIEVLPKTANITSMILSRFRKNGKPVSEKVARSIFRYSGGHPHYIDLLSRVTFVLAKKTCTISTVERAHSFLMDQFSVYYEKKAESLTNHQLNFLRAYCENGVSLCSARILDQYNLGSSANVSRVKESLCRKEIIDVIRGHIYLLDPLFIQWLERYYFR